MYEPKPERAHDVPLPLALSKADGQRLMQFIAQRVRNPADRADLMQEVLTRALKRPAEEIKDPLKYLRGIAWNVLSDFFRNKRERGAVIFDSTLVDGSAEQPRDALPNALTEQEALTAQMDAERMVCVALGRLPLTHREVLLLTMGAGFSYEETARTLRLSVHTVKKYAYEAKMRIRMMTPASGASPGGEAL
jgi:RNA polymerase sigma factor (sigma-70 family)